MSIRSYAAVALCAAAVVAAACGGSSQQGGEKPAAGAAPAAPAATANLPEPPAGSGTVTGHIKFEGTAPGRLVIRMGSDPACVPEGERPLSEATIVGDNNGLQNVFVYVKDAFGGQTFRPPADPVELNQQGCRYVPHVFGVQVGQTVRIVNSDMTLHNVHARPNANEEFNFGQAAKVPPATRIFQKPEVMVPFRCDVHGWMNAYAGVMPHPFFAVSKEDGSFEIKNLPAGTYTLEAWHERLGTQTQMITSDGKTATTADFAFKPQTSS